MKNLKTISTSRQEGKLFAWRFMARFFFPVLLAVLVSAPDCRAELADLLEISKVVPDRDVVMKGESRNGWKDIWNEARLLARAGDSPAAEKKYKELLFIKGGDIYRDIYSSTNYYTGYHGDDSINFSPVSIDLSI